MPRLKRKLLGELFAYHMVQGTNKANIFKDTEDKEKYLYLLKKYYMNFNINIVAYCIMDNHAHLLLYSSGIQNISNFMQKVNCKYAMYYNRKKDRRGYVFKNRFELEPIIDKRQIRVCIKYIHMNPVRAGIARKEKDYKFSSYNSYIKKECFINQKILKFVFNSENSYLNDFYSIKYEELNFDIDKIDPKLILNRFLFQERYTLDELRQNRVLIKKFICYIISNQYKCSKKDIAKILKMSRQTLYRRLSV